MKIPPGERLMAYSARKSSRLLNRYWTSSDTWVRGCLRRLFGFPPGAELIAWRPVYPACPEVSEHRLQRFGQSLHRNQRERALLQALRGALGQDGAAEPHLGRLCQARVRLAHRAHL